MHNKRVLLLNAFVFIAFMAYSLSEPTKNLNCRERPRKLIKTAKTCCEIPTPHFENFNEECPVLGEENATIYCQLECLFNVSNALETQNLNLAKLHRLLDQVFPGAVDFVAAYYISYEECIPLVKQSLNNRIGIKHKCAPTATLYAACAQMKLLKHCPAKAWNGTEFCEKSKKYVNRCADNLLRYRKKSSQLRLNETSQLEAENATTFAPKLDKFTEEPKYEILNSTDTKNETNF